MATFEIPLTAEPQRFGIQLAGVDYRLRLTYQDAPEGGWLLDILDTDDAPIACGLPLVTGADLLEQFAYLGIGGALYVTTDGDPDAVPTFDNLGGASHLLFVTT